MRMIRLSIYNRAAVFLAALTLTSCASLTLQWVDYSWPVESVLKINQHNTVEEGRYAISIQVTNLALEEFQDSTALIGTSIRLIRSEEGYYFVTGPKFKNVYVFTPGASELNLKSKIQLSETGMKAPAMNQRSPYVEVVDGKNWKRFLTSDSIVEEKKQ
ncbi:MAG: hypothetical protein HW412_1185 [Bacteroidetes bacterium]|nr:hypothetical protein [Bacteroidota bacterium]